MDNQIVINFKNLTKQYHDLIAVQNLNLEVKKGEILGFVGPNGAGKTTTMKMLGNLVKPTSGIIEISDGKGNLINTIDYPNEIYQKFGFLIDLPAFYDKVTPNQILTYYCQLLGVPKEKIQSQIDWALEIVDLLKWKNKKIKEFSKGMTQRLGLAQSLVHDPEVVILDEPQTGLDPAARVHVREIIKKINKIGKTIFLSSHLLYEISEICNRIAIINNGRLIAVNTLANLEQKMTKKELQCELLEPLSISQINVIQNDLNQKLKPYNIDTGKEFVFYDDNIPGFNIYYDGKPTSRKEIHDILTFDMKLPIIGFSKVRTSRLEDLYLDLINADVENSELSLKFKRGREKKK
ncbi:MAG: ABC transporter ATP-binding protein [Promethearchaeota archaeon]